MFENKSSQEYFCTMMKQENKLNTKMMTFEKLIEEFKQCKIYFQKALQEEFKEGFKILRNLIEISKKLCTDEYRHYHNTEIVSDALKLCVDLFGILAYANLPLDALMVASTALCHVLLLALKPQRINKIFKSCFKLNAYRTFLFIRFTKYKCVKLVVQNVECFHLTLSHGILQLNSTSHVFEDPDNLKHNVSSLLCIIFNVLKQSCRKYSKYTLISFKTLVLWIQKMIDFLGSKYCLTGKTVHDIFTIVNCNWESSINSVREQNTKILQLLFYISDEILQVGENGQYLVPFTASNILYIVMTEQPWRMKSKYFMLEILLPMYGVKKALEDFPLLTKGLVWSLSCSHLVSAGTLAYRACLKDIDERDWMLFFMPAIEVVVTTENNNDISVQEKNVFDYWILPTLKKFPSLLMKIIVYINKVSDCSKPSCSLLFCIISLVRLGRKKGIILSLWQPEMLLDTSFDLEYLTNIALQHPSEIIRSQCFSLICSTSKTSTTPTTAEFLMISSFLIENVNTDNAAFRQIIFNSFVLFLIRIRESCYKELKKSKYTVLNTIKMEETNQPLSLNGHKCSTLLYKSLVNNFIFTDTQMHSESAFTKTVYFLEWLYYFITLNLEPGSNYQRKILSLQLCESVLMYLGSVGEHNQKTSMFNQKKISPTESFAVMKCIIECEKWHFTSEESRKMLLVCVEDSTDDIRETAARILIHFFNFRENVNEGKKLLRKALYLCKSSKFYTAESGALLIKIINAWIYGIQKNNADKKLEIRELISYIYLNSEIGIHLDIYENNPLSNEQKSNFEIEEFSEISSNDEDYSDTPNEFNNIVLDAQKKLLIGLRINPDTFQDDLYEHSSLFPWNINKSELQYDKYIPISEQNNTKSKKKLHTINETIKMVYKTSDETMKISLKSRPRTFEGLVVEDIKELEKISDTQIPDRMKSFEGLCVVNPKDGLVGPNIMKAVISSPKYKTNKPSNASYVGGKRFVKTQKIRQSTPSYQTLHKHFASIKFGTLASQTDINENGRKMSFIMQPHKSAECLETLAPLHFQTHGSDNTIYSRRSPDYISDSGRPCTLSGLLLCCAEWQAQLLQQDLWQAASSGAPLHGLLTALSLVAAHPTGAEISILNAAEVERLVCLMERVVAHLLSVLASKANNITNFAPSFAEMAEAIDSTFCDILSRDEEEVMDITPAHQLVINCIWFNLKACCNLSSELASIESTASDIAERCGLLIVRVLKQCRHKGVIESAGMSLSNLIKMMTSNKCMRACHDLPERILTEFLDVLQEGSSAASVTRRCAGLAILVHKIVASDKHKNRPLLHLCVSRLLKIAADPVRLYSSDTSDLPSTQALHFLCMLVQDSALCQNVAAYMSDITQLCFKKLSSNIWTVRNAALQLFGALVPKLVGEKKNNDENMIGGNSVTVEEFFYHYPTLVELFLAKLQNVSTSMDLLQHSALVPMLYLLSKLSVGVQAFFNQECCENVRKLRKYFMTLTSSKIIAVRKLSAKAYVNFTPFSNISGNMENILDDMKNLDKKFDYIRCINTRTHEHYGYPPRLVLDFDDTIYTVPENELHGVLTILLYQQERLENESVEMSNLTSHLSERLIDKISEMRFLSFLQIDAITYYNRAIVNELYLKVCSHIEAPVYDAAIEVLSLHEILLNKYETSKLKLAEIGCVTIPCVGLSVWAKTFVEILLYNCSQHQLEEALIAIFKMSQKFPNYTEAALEATKCRLKKETHIVFADVKTKLLCAFITTLVHSTYISHQIIFHILDTMLFLLKEGSLTYETIAVHDDFQFIIKAFQEKSLSKVFKTNSYISLPVMCGLVAIHIQHSYNASSTEEKITLFLKVVQVLSESCNPQSVHEDFRLSASVSLQLLALTLKVIIAYRSFLVSNKCLDVIGRTIVNSALILLQDESTCVRNEAAKFVAIYNSYSNISTTEYRMLSASNCIKMILEVDFLLTLLSRPVALLFLWESLSCLKDLENIRTIFIGVQHMEDITNPFDHGVRNIYAEETKVIDLFAQSLLTFVQSSKNSELIELKKFSSVRAESYDTDIEYVLQLLGKKFDQDDCTHISSSMLTTLSVVLKKLKYQLLLMFQLKVCSSYQMVSLCKKIGFENL